MARAEKLASIPLFDSLQDGQLAAILGDGRRTATVTASSPSSLLVVFGSEFRRLEAAHPDIR
jgi:CRP-like cAMP-binding protein